MQGTTNHTFVGAGRLCKACGTTLNAPVHALPYTPEQRAALLAAGCRWFAMCNNAATSLRVHPIIGDVPICDRCNAKVDAIESGTR